MKLSYESRLEDVTESAVRAFLRGKAGATARWRGAALCAGVFAVFAFLGFHAREVFSVVWICAAAAAWGAGLFLLTYKSTVRRRIANHVSRELSGRLPQATTLEITDRTLGIAGAGSGGTFRLSDLAGVSEDARYLELSFGTQGVSVIPLRVFSTAHEKAAFLSALQTQDLPSSS